MERTEVLDLMSGLKLYGMRSAYDETLAAALKRKHEPQRFVGDLLKAEISEKQARSIKYQLTVAKLPLAKDVVRNATHQHRDPKPHHHHDPKSDDPRFGWRLHDQTLDGKRGERQPQ